LKSSRRGDARAVPARRSAIAACPASSARFVPTCVGSRALDRDARRRQRARTESKLSFPRVAAQTPEEPIGLPAWVRRSTGTAARASAGAWSVSSATPCSTTTPSNRLAVSRQALSSSAIGLTSGSFCGPPRAARLETYSPLRGDAPLLSRFPTSGKPSGNAARHHEEHRVDRFGRTSRTDRFE
jgi:hypothetical protein